MKNTSFFKCMALALPILFVSSASSMAQTASKTSPQLVAGSVIPPEELGVGSKCRKKQNFFLRSKISGTSLFFCDLDKSDGAKFNFTRNSVTDSTMLNSEAGVGIRLGGIQSIGKRTRVGYVGFAEIDSTTKSNGTDEGQIRIGFDGNFITDFGSGRARPGSFSRKLGGSLIYDLSAYYLTDVNFDARGWGVKATAHPTVPGLRVNSKTEKQKFYWSFDADLELLKLEEAGNTGLDDDTDYAWVGYSLKGVYEAKPKAFSNGIETSFGSNYAKDTVSGEEFHELVFETKVFLDEDKRVALSLKHARGETRKNPTFDKTTSLDLQFKF